MVSGIRERRYAENLGLVSQAREVATKRAILWATNHAFNLTAMRELAQKLLQVELPTAIAQIVSENSDFDAWLGPLSCVS
jgi:hypothetical protein